MNPDLRMFISSENFAVLYGSEDIIAKAQEMNKTGLIRVDVLKDDVTMSAKGYKSIYDALPNR